MAKRVKIIAELMQTEKDYISDLDLCIKEVIQPLRKKQVSAGGGGGGEVVMSGSPLTHILLTDNLNASTDNFIQPFKQLLWRNTMSNSPVSTSEFAFYMEKVHLRRDAHKLSFRQTILLGQ